MSYTYAVSPDHPLCGTWFHRGAVEGRQYQHIEYTISVFDKQFRITAIDWASNEELIICDVAYDGEWVRFQSLDPSTGRSGRNWMRVVEDDKIEFRFTFTEREFWCRKTSGAKNTRCVSPRRSQGRRTSDGQRLVSASAAH